MSLLGDIDKIISEFRQRDGKEPVIVCLDYSGAEVMDMMLMDTIKKASTGIVIHDFGPRGQVTDNPTIGDPMYDHFKGDQS